MLNDISEKTVLVVEDNYLNLKLARDLIKLEKHRVLEAENAEKGIELARLHRPDLILMDIELPGMDGIEATHLIRNDPVLTKIPVLALTAYAMEEEKQKARHAGFNGYITKPINIKAFQKTINEHLRKTLTVMEKDHSSSSRRILIVDDEPLNIKLLAAQISAKGYHVIKACDGETALEKVKTEHPDLILLDIMMPGIDGYEVTKRLKAEPYTRNIPIILITALTGEEDKKKGLNAGADEFINKPINFPELEARLRSLLRLKEYREQFGMRKNSESLMVKDDQKTRNEVNSNRNLPTLLIVEDDSSAAKLMMQFLSDMPCNFLTAKSGEEAIRITAERKIDVMLLDLMLPNMNGFEVCKTIKENEETFPIQVVMVTSLADTENRLRGIEAGTDDFLTKPVDKDEVCARIRSLLKKKSYLDQLLEKVDTALNAAITDKLTGIYNHGYFKHFLELEFKRSKQHKHNLALLMIDVDNFKAFNDKYGHQCGDQALKIIGKTLRENVREIDLVARYGGEEFAVTLPYANLDMAKNIAERLIRSIGEIPDIPPASGAGLSISIGISAFPDFAYSSEELLQTADKALYNAKKNGKNRFSSYGEQGMKLAITGQYEVKCND